MVIHRTKEFCDEFERLPRDIQRLFQKQENIFKDNWLDPRLRVKRLKELPGVYAFRVTRRCRVLFYFAGDAAVFFSLGHRREVYR